MALRERIDVAPSRHADEQGTSMTGVQGANVTAPNQNSFVRTRGYRAAAEAGWLTFHKETFPKNSESDCG